MAANAHAGNTSGNTMSDSDVTGTNMIEGNPAEADTSTANMSEDDMGGDDLSDAGLSLDVPSEEDSYEHDASGHDAIAADMNDDNNSSNIRNTVSALLPLRQLASRPPRHVPISTIKGMSSFPSKEKIVLLMNIYSLARIPHQHQPPMPHGGSFQPNQEVPESALVPNAPATQGEHRTRHRYGRQVHYWSQTACKCFGAGMV
jgi:hypothetical protein